MRKNHFNSMSNDQLKECYQSYKKLTDEGSERPELSNIKLVRIDQKGE